MPPPRSRLPDGPLSSFQSIPPPPALRGAFLRAAAEAAARYLRGGGRLRDIRPEESRMENGRLILAPVPRGGPVEQPDRARLWRELPDLESSWIHAAPRAADRAAFFLWLCRTLDRPDSADAWRAWGRVRLREHRLARAADNRIRYRARMAESPRRDGWTGCWRPDPDPAPEELRDELEGLRRNAKPLRGFRKRRAHVFSGTVRGREAVIKRYEPNPSGWKRRWESSRARRSWAGARLLEELGVDAVRALGWLEHRENGKLKESWFIAEPLPARESLRVWLRREWPRMDERERILFRHRLREELLSLDRLGLVHIDFKLPNLMVRESPDGRTRFYLLDLEDLRPRPLRLRTLIRNLYQLNGSLPRSVSREHRLAFVRGFRRRFPRVAHPLVLRYIEKKTRARMRRELRRVCGV